MLNTIPGGPDEITTTWLTEALRAAGAIDTSVIERVTTEVIGADRGFTGVVARVEPGYDRPEPSAPATLIVKFPIAPRSASSYRDEQQPSPEQRQRYWERCIREVHFYRDVAPRVAMAPRAYAAHADVGTNRMVLLLEDLSASEPGDALLGCTISQAALAVDAMATFHAAWWQHAALAHLAWLPRWPSDPATSAARYDGQVESVSDRYGERIPATVHELMRQLVGQYESVLNALSQRPVTMIHGDFHLDNLVFSRPGEPPAVTVIDWQSVARGPAVVDLSLFMVGSLSAADRRASEFDLLSRYHQLLVEHGVREYSFDDLQADYRLALLWQLAGTVGWLARIEPRTLDGRELALVEAIFTSGKVFQAVEDHSDER